MPSLRDLWPPILVVAIIIIIWVLIWVTILSAAKRQSFLDYMPTAIEPCPSHYRCGATSREQVRLENNLFSDLRESNKYALPETVTTDQYDVIASEAEPTDCMMKRAAAAYEGPLAEGQYTPWDEIENRYLTRKSKESVLTKSAAKETAM